MSAIRDRKPFLLLQLVYQFIIGFEGLPHVFTSPKKKRAPAGALFGHGPRKHP